MTRGTQSGRLFHLIGAIAAALLLIAVAFQLPACCLTTSRMPLLPPGWPNLLGTDRLGRDVALVTLSASAYSVILALMVLAISTGLGLCTALISATFWEKWPDGLLSVSAEAIRSFPSLVLALLFLAASVPVNFVLMLYFWIPIWRVMRSRLAAQRNRPYVLVSLLAGHTRLRTMAVHVLPNVMSGFRNIILLLFVEILSVQAGLEFLGFSAPLSRPTLGNVTSEAMRLGGSFAWVWLPAALVAAVIAVTLVQFSRQNMVEHRGRLE